MRTLAGRITTSAVGVALVAGTIIGCAPAKKGPDPAVESAASRVEAAANRAEMAASSATDSARRAEVAADKVEAIYSHRPGVKGQKSKH